MPYSGDATLHELCVVDHSKNEPPMAEMGQSEKISRNQNTAAFPLTADAIGGAGHRR
jgi:hypothetical protein